jgi:ribosomal protein S17E
MVSNHLAYLLLPAGRFISTKFNLIVKIIMEELNIKYPDPLTDKQKEAIFGVKIEHLTPKEIIEKYGDILTEEQKIALGITE